MAPNKLTRLSSKDVLMLNGKYVTTGSADNTNHLMQMQFRLDLYDSEVRPAEKAFMDMIKEQSVFFQNYYQKT